MGGVIWFIDESLDSGSQILSENMVCNMISGEKSGQRNEKIGLEFCESEFATNSQHDKVRLGARGCRKSLKNLIQCL